MKGGIGVARQNVGEGPQGRDREKTQWSKIKLASGKQFESFKEIKRMMRSKTLHTVCEEANARIFMSAGRTVQPRS